jgi:class 3 adenylate cyclase
MGPATVGTVGCEGRIDYTAIGDVINLASRLCSSALDTQILLDPILAGAVGESIAIHNVGKRSLKGYDTPMPVFSVS